MTTQQPKTATQLIFGREPAFWTGLLQGLISILTAFGLKVSTEQQGVIMAFASALFGAWLAYQVRPISVAAFTAFLQASLSLLVAFGLSMTIEQQGVVLTVSAVLLNLLVVRPQVTPSKGWILNELLYRAADALDPTPPRHRKAE